MKKSDYWPLFLSFTLVSAFMLIALEVPVIDELQYYSMKVVQFFRESTYWSNAKQM